VRRACNGEAPQIQVNRELQPAIQQYRLPFELFDDLLKGVGMDLDIKRYDDYAQLELYCYRVASVVGLLSIEIFGYKNTACRDYAIYLGKALQLTNILRDVRSDASADSLYSPHDWRASKSLGRNPASRIPERLPNSRSVAERAIYRLARVTFRKDRRASPPADGVVVLAAVAETRSETPTFLARLTRLGAQSWFDPARLVASPPRRDSNYGPDHSTRRPIVPTILALAVR
jgi:phytoene synthase